MMAALDSRVLPRGNAGSCPTLPPSGRDCDHPRSAAVLRDQQIGRQLSGEKEVTP
jgi:hypothetical protein